MPTITSTDKVLVTGANGYIALWLVKTLLERGNYVRGSVRSETKGRVLQELFKTHGDRLEIVVVPDMTKEGAWDEAVKGVQAVEHTATPVDFFAPNPKPEGKGLFATSSYFIEPAIKGTVRILESALKYKGAIKRIIVTSSLGAVVNPTDAPRAYTEEDWNESSLKEVEEKGAEAGVRVIYRASKVLAERAAWDFYKKYRDEVKWDLTTICPPLVIGAPLGEVSSAAELNTSLKFFWTNIASDAPKTREQLGEPSVFGDVRDLAEAHVLALEKEKAGGERIFVNAGSYVWQDFLDIANRLSIPGRNLSPGFPDLDRGVKGLSFSTTKSVEILGMKYRSLEDTTRHTLEDFSRRGF
ncbi:D-lactaldehyde dehydrogenase [Coprinopsis sp. MPI-PUGE-AT-0042]|nr:D-lactaldehyde dehydrogenase [Coprinopsis sp. MPI-PUGE-AT-0042]